MEQIFNNKTQKNITLTIGIITLAIIIGILFKITNDDYNRQIQNINKRFAPEMSKCWQEVKETGQTCNLEYITVDGGQTPVSAKVVKR